MGGNSLRALAFFGGGTGGHLFPGIAVAERAQERFPGCRAVFFRTSRGVEDRVFEGRNLETVGLKVHPPGKSFQGWLRYSVETASASREVCTFLGKNDFDVAFGLGGYASLPGLLAAGEASLPRILLEQNHVPGKVNALIAPFADAVCCAFEETSFLLPTRSEVTGNPVRKEVLDAARSRESRARIEGMRTVLLIGGSQGAKGLNRAIGDSLPHLLEFREKIDWIHVAGDADKENMSGAYRRHGFKARVFAYTSFLPDLMAESDLALGRAGGTTLSELAVMGLPAVLVPYPHHGDRHQYSNAEALVKAGAACLLDEKEINPGSLRALFHDVLFAPERLEAMGRSAHALARPDAADLVLNLALDLKRRCPQAFVSFS